MCYPAVNVPHPKAADELSPARHAMRLVRTSEVHSLVPKETKPSLTFGVRIVAPSGKVRTRRGCAPLARGKNRM